MSEHHCSRCLYTDRHPFGLTFSQGICSGCLTHEEKDELDWGRRRQMLADRLDTYRGLGTYDCVVPVIGDAEDYFVVGQVLELGLHPLIVSVNDYFYNDIGWHNLHNLITHFDVDSLVYNPDLTTYRELIRTSLRKFDHMLWPGLALRSAFPMHIAHDRGIRLVITGQSQAVEQVGKFSHLDAVEINKWSRTEHDLFNQDVDGMVGTGAQVDVRSLNYYQYPSIKSLARRGVVGIHLSNYLRWDPLAQNRLALDQGFKPQYNPASFDPYERAGSSVYYGIHDLLKLKRCGYRKATDQLVREIRHGRINRTEAQELDRRYCTQRVPIAGFFDWLGVTRSGYQWFLEHCLGDVAHLVGEPGEAPKLPAALVDMLTTAHRPERDFVAYGKGI